MCMLLYVHVHTCKRVRVCVRAQAHVCTSAWSPVCIQIVLVTLDSVVWFVI